MYYQMGDELLPLTVANHRRRSQRRPSLLGECVLC
jgi:hypothetical protein